MFFSSLNPISLILLSSELFPVENVGQCGKAQPPLATLALVRPQRSSRNWSTQLRWHRLKTCVPRCVVWICLVLRVLAFGACRQNFWAWRVPSMCRARCFNTLIESSKGLQGATVSIQGISKHAPVCGEWCDLLTGPKKA